jgi:hypothetical protein
MNMFVQNHGQQSVSGCNNTPKSQHHSIQTAKHVKENYYFLIKF